MKDSIKYIVYLSFFGLLLACIEPEEIRIEEAAEFLTVEGEITTQPGPHIIRLTNSARYGSVVEGSISPRRSANVSIRDNTGQITFLNNIDNGNYATPENFSLIVGREYSLLIETADGRNYLSIPTAVTAVPEIQELKYRFKSLATENEFIRTSGLEVYSSFENPNEGENFYMWRNSGSYRIVTFPENYVDPVAGTPAPKECCNICWVTEKNADKSINILNGSAFNSGLIEYPVAFIEDEGSRFTDRYVASIQQLSISKDAHQYFRVLDQQLQIQGSIFDPPPATLRGNMISIDDPEETVLGYVLFADVAEKRISLPREALDFTQPLRTINNDCREVRNASLEVPDEWLE